MEKKPLRETGWAEIGAFLPFFAVVLPAILLLRGSPAPHGNELFYLLRLVREWQPAFLGQDWTFATASPEHKMFNLLFGWPTLFLPLEYVAWGGRILIYTLNAHALFRLSRSMGVARWAAAGALILWVAGEQAPVSGEWIFGTLEAKGVAYALLFYSMERFAAGKHLAGAALMGFCFSLHPAVGLWGGLALAAALPFAGYPPKRLAAVAGLAFVCALPGAVPVLATSALESSEAADGIWRFLALVRMPYHFDALAWPRREIAGLYLMLFFCALRYRACRDVPALRIAIVFLAASGGFFALGVLFRIQEDFDLLKLMPFRVFSVTCPIFFLFMLARAYTKGTQPLPGKFASAVALLAVFGMNNPLGKAADKIGHTRSDWTRPREDYVEALRWVSSHTPESAIVIMPPWKRENWYYSRRAHIANFHFNPYDRLGGWMARITAQVGPITDPDFDRSAVEMRRRYSALDAGEILALGRDYGGDFLLTESAYPFASLGAWGPWKLYRLPEAAIPPEILR